MTDVFLSYSHIDQALADEICALLDELGVSYFRDEKSIAWGDSIDSEVRVGLDQAAMMLLIVSPASLKSWWVIYEVGYAVGQRKRLLPFLTHLSLELPPYLAHLKHCSRLDDVREYFSTRREREGSAAAPVSVDSRLRKLRELMPNLLAEMAEDIAGDDTGLITELAVLPSEHVVFNSGKARFVYYEDKHPNLQNQVDLLEEYGLLRDVTTGNVPIYRLTQEFKEALAKGV